MRLLALVFAVFAVTGCITAGSVGEIEKSHDDIYDTTSTSLHGMYVARSDSGALSEVSVFAVPSSQYVSLTVRSGNPCWSWIRCDFVTVVVDGVIFDGEGEHRGSALGYSMCMESLSLKLPVEAFVKLRSASSIKVRACNATSTLSPEQVVQVKKALR